MESATHPYFGYLCKLCFLFGRHQPVVTVDFCEDVRGPGYAPAYPFLENLPDARIILRILDSLFFKLCRLGCDALSASGDARIGTAFFTSALKGSAFRFGPGFKRRRRLRQLPPLH